MGRGDYSDDERRHARKKQHSKRDDDDDNRGRRKKESKKKKKRKRDYYSSSEDDSGESSDDSRRRKKKKHKKKRYDIGSGSSSDDDDDSTDESRRRQKKHKKKKHKKEKKKRRDRGDTTSSSTKEADPLERNYAFADALHDLLDDHPALSSDLPIMLIRMAGGASFDLSQMSDVGAAQGLEKVFQCLQTYGVERVGTSWTWKSPAGGQGRNNHELLLLKISRTLLDQVGITMEAVDNYGKPVQQEPVPQEEREEPPKREPATDTPLQKQTFALLDRFLQKDATLANQLGDLCSMILSGESVALDGLPDQRLREGLEQLFRGAGLGLAVIEEDSDDEEVEETKGYGLPEDNDQFARVNMAHILLACKSRAATQKEAPKRAMRGPLPQHMAAEYQSRVQEMDDDDDDDGPAPAGAVMRTRVAPSKEDIAATAESRRQEMESLVSGGAFVTKPGEREEWMINPGEHDLLQGIKAGAMKTRNFENKKVKGPVAEMPAAPVDPSMQAEVDAILQAHKDARGPSLMEQHRESVAAEKAEKAKDSGKSFNWSRDKDLDAGRRVDKEALRLLMGGAGSELMDKFQGGFTKT